MELALDRAEEALEYMENVAAAGPGIWPGLLVICLMAAGHTERAREKLKTLEMEAENQFVHPMQFALAYMAANDMEKGCVKSFV